MSNKMIEVKNCAECPHSYEESDYLSCNYLGTPDDFVVPDKIPDWCPLPDTTPPSDEQEAKAIDCKNECARGRLMDKNDFLAVNAIRNSPELKEYLTKQLDLWEKQIIDETRKTALKEVETTFVEMFANTFIYPASIEDNGKIFNRSPYEDGWNKAVIELTTAVYETLDKLKDSNNES